MMPGARCGTRSASSRFLSTKRSLAVAAEHHVEGHHPSVVSRHEMEQLVEKMRLAERAAAEGVAIPAPDEEIAYFVDAFTAGRH